MGERAPLHVCPGCGSVRDDLADLVAALELPEPSVEALVELLETKDRTIADLERDLRAKRATISRMRADRDKQDRLNPHFKAAKEVFEYWQQKLAPRAREFNGKRLRNVLARLEHGATVDEIKEAIDGMALRPYVSNGRRSPVGTKEERFADLALICASEEHLARFRAYVETDRLERDTQDEQLEHECAVMVGALTDRLAGRLLELRGWTLEAIRDLGLGYDSRTRRVVFPIRDREGRLVGLSRYQPNPERRGGQPKNLAEGPRDLFPAPESLEPGGTVWLVEGEPDAVAMRSLGFKAVGVPGTQGWRDEWAARFGRFDLVKVLFDCDGPGRKAAAERVAQLAAFGKVEMLDLDPARDDGHDVGDVLKEHGREAARGVLEGLKPVPAPAPRKKPGKPSRRLSVDPEPVRREPSLWGDPYGRVVAALESAGCKVRDRGDRAEAECPAHDDRRPSLSVARGEDGICLIHCFAGCAPDEVIRALGLEWRELFGDNR